MALWSTELILRYFSLSVRSARDRHEWVRLRALRA